MAIDKPARDDDASCVIDDERAGVVVADTVLAAWSIDVVEVPGITPGLWLAQAVRASVMVNASTVPMRFRLDMDVKSS